MLFNNPRKETRIAIAQELKSLSESIVYELEDDITLSL